MQRGNMLKGLEELGRATIGPVNPNASNVGPQGMVC